MSSWQVSWPRLVVRWRSEEVDGRDLRYPRPYSLPALEAPRSAVWLQLGDETTCTGASINAWKGSNSCVVRTSLPGLYFGQTVGHYCRAEPTARIPSDEDAFVLARSLC